MFHRERSPQKLICRLLCLSWLLLALSSVGLHAAEPAPDRTTPVASASAATAADAADAAQAASDANDGLAAHVSGADASTQPAVMAILGPIKTDSPRETLRSFMDAMNRYVEALNSGDTAANAWLDDATRCLDISKLSTLGKVNESRDAARSLKEVIDRIIIVDDKLVPGTHDVLRWRLKNTEITIYKVTEGDRKGEYLFHPDTVQRAQAFFDKIVKFPRLPGTMGGGYSEPWQQHYMPSYLNAQALGLSAWQWISISLLIFIGLVVRRLVMILSFFLKKLTARTSVTWDDELLDSLHGPMTHLGTTGIWFASLHLLGITGTPYTVIAFFIKAAFFINISYLAYNLAGFVGAVVERRMLTQRPEISTALLRMLRQTGQIMALLFCVLLGAQNMGLDVASLIAGLGIGGLAVALAAKDTLANLFGSIMIMIDHPFRIGDWVIVKGAEGTVEDIGFRCTRIRTFYDSMISIPNAEMVNANVDNMGMRTYRRTSMTLSVTYDTPADKVAAFCEGVRKVILDNPASRKDLAHVYFSGYGASSLDIMVYFFLKVPNWGEELLHRQEVYLEILRLAETQGVRFAFPTQTLHLESVPAGMSANLSGSDTPAGVAAPKQS